MAIIYPAPGCEPKNCDNCEGNYILNFIEDAACLYASSLEEAIAFCDSYREAYGDPLVDDNLYALERVNEEITVHVF